MRKPRVTNAVIARAQPGTSMLEAIVSGLEVYKNATGHWPAHIAMCVGDIEKLREEMKAKCYFNSGYTKDDAPMAVYGVPVIEG